jgi:hypothetical protein
MIIGIIMREEKMLFIGIMLIVFLVVGGLIIVGIAKMIMSFNGNRKSYKFND